MGLTVKAPDGGEFKQIEPGVYRAVCIGVIDLGTVFNKAYSKNQHQILIIWELPDATIKIEGVVVPIWKFKKFTASLSEKAELRKTLQAWRGSAFTGDELKGFQLDSILSACCQIAIVHEPAKDGSGKVYANISSIMPLPRGMAPFPSKTKPMLFDFEESSALPEGLPDWVVEQIKAAPEWATWVRG